jgi:hypothetical protein
MDKNARWAAGVIIILVVLGGIGLAIYAVHKHHEDHTAPYSTNPGPYTNSTSSTQSTPPNTNATAPASTPSCFTASQAASEEGQTGCVQFTGYSYTSGSGQMYLDQSLSPPYGFSVWIPAGTSGGASLLNEYSGKNIDVTGSIVNYKGNPEIEVTSASQITLVS